MIFNCKIALLGLATVVSSHAGNPRFDIHDCDHLRLSEDDQCVETTFYGNNLDCEIRVLSDMRLDVRRWDVENHSRCAWDYLEAKGADDMNDRRLPRSQPDKRFCTESPDGYDLYKGQILHWHTDHYATKTGWKICAAPKFRFRGSCDHLDITDDGNCLETRVSGDNHHCTVETTGTFLYTSNKFDLEYEDRCEYDWLKIGGVKKCNLWRDRWNLHGALVEWHTNNSVPSGFRICGDSCLKTHTSYGGPDIVPYSVFTDSALECQKMCATTTRCYHFTYNAGNRRCHMKNNLVDPNYDAHPMFISGKRDCRGSGNWRRLEDSKQGGSRLLKLAQILDMNTEKDVKMEKEE